MSENVQNLNELNRQRNKNVSYGEGQPHLEISEQPQSRGFRFRYQCEGTSHGGLQGETSRRDHKTYPGVKIVGFKGPARITVTLVTDENVPRPHAHELIGKNCKNGICVVDLKGDHMIATFPNLGIRHVTKKKVVNILTERIVEAMKVDKMMAGGVGYDPERVVIQEEEKNRAHAQAEDQAKNMSLNTVRLCFQAYLQDQDGTFSKMLPSVISNPIYDSKSPGAAALKICRMDKHAGCCLGNDEVFMLCDKVQKDDIAVRFYEEDDEGNVRWQGYGQFGPADVHRQYAIVFKTPQYFNGDIDKPVQVQVQLVRMSDQECSDPKPFTYYPQQRDQEEIDKKRRKQIPHFGGGGSISGQFGSGDASSRGSPSGQGRGAGLAGGNVPLNNYSTSPNAPAKPVRLSPATPPPDESSRESHTSVSSMSVSSAGSNDLCIDVETDCDAETSKQDSGVDSLISHVKTDSGHSQKSAQPYKFMKQGNSANISEKNRMDPLSVAWQIAERTSQALQGYAKTGDIFCLLAVQRHLIAVQDECGDNVLHTAIMNNRAEVVCHLLEAVRTIPKNKVVNQCNYLRQTPLHLAVLTNQPDVVELLLHSGAAMYVQDKNGCTPIHLAAKYGFEKCLDLMLTFGNSPFGSDKKPYPEIDFLNYEGFSALHLAVSLGTLNPVKMLVEEGYCNVNQPDGRSGRTALHHAVNSDNLAISGYLLLDGDADPDSPDYDGNTPLHLAAAADNLGIAAILVATGASPDMENSWVKEELEREEGEPGAAGAKRKADTEMDWADYLDDIVGCTPRDLVVDNEKMLRVLAGESYTKITNFGTQTPGYESTGLGAESMFFDSGIMPPGDLDRLNVVTRARIASMLDKPTSPNWRDLAEQLGLGVLAEAFSLTPSPTKTLLDNYDVLDGTVADLDIALNAVGRQDVSNMMVQLLKKDNQQVHVLASSMDITSTGSESITFPGSSSIKGVTYDSVPRDSGFSSVHKSMAHLHLDTFK